MKRLVTLTFLVTMAFPPRDAWFGADKLKHFLMSALVQSATFSIARSAGAGHGSAMAAGVSSALTVGLVKEFHDKRVGKPFSAKDLFWDAAGTASAAALLHRSR